MNIYALVFLILSEDEGAFVVVIVAALLASHTFLFQGGGGFPQVSHSLSLSLSLTLLLCEGHDDRSNSRKV